jgi:hypothetical protein
VMWMGGQPCPGCRLGGGFQPRMRRGVYFPDPDGQADELRQTQTCDRAS